jgi:hypothetical protein
MCSDPSPEEIPLQFRPEMAKLTPLGPEYTGRGA